MAYSLGGGGGGEGGEQINVKRSTVLFDPGQFAWFFLLNVNVSSLQII
jgi:hypothetical protein